MGFEDKFNGAKQRFSAIRFRTWTLTLSIIVALIFYLLVTISTKQSITWFDFILLCSVQIVCHSLYFPDGEIYGQKDDAFISNKTSYNTKATEINDNKNISKLREYCKIEYEKRKENYIQSECGIIGISSDELEIFKQMSEKEIKKLKMYEIKETINGEEKSKFLIFSRSKRKKLYNLIFKPLPVEENHPETIMSAVEINSNKAIKDGSKTYKAYSYIRKIMQAVVIGGIFSYIGYTLRDGIGLTEIVQIVMYLTTMFTTIVMAFSSGETCSSVYKSRFYLELSNFIDGFNEWLG